MSVTVTVDLKGVQKKFSGVARLKGQRAMANQAHSDMNQFVPALSYDLRNQSAIGLDGSSIYYNVPYARRMFYTQFTNYTTAGTGPRWDLKAKSLYMNDWVKAYVGGAGL